MPFSAKKLRIYFPSLLCCLLLSSILSWSVFVFYTQIKFYATWMVKDLAKKTVLATNAKLTRHYMYENYGK